MGRKASGSSKSRVRATNDVSVEVCLGHFWSCLTLGDFSSTSVGLSHLARVYFSACRACLPLPVGTGLYCLFDGAHSLMRTHFIFFSVRTLSPINCSVSVSDCSIQCFLGTLIESGQLDFLPFVASMIMDDTFSPNQIRLFFSKFFLSIWKCLMKA